VVDDDVLVGYRVLDAATGSFVMRDDRAGAGGRDVTGFVTRGEAAILASKIRTL
jgi:hypothetical protein